MNNRIFWKKAAVILIAVIFVSAVFIQPAHAWSFKKAFKSFFGDVVDLAARAVTVIANAITSAFNYLAGSAIKISGFLINSSKLQQLGDALINDSKCRVKNIFADPFQDMRAKCQTGSGGSGVVNLLNPPDPNPDPIPNPSPNPFPGPGPGNGNGSSETPPGRIIENNPGS